jgi:hypothetical protein
MQTPSEYEGANGEMLQAIPMGTHGGSELVTTGVESTFLVHPSVAVEIKAVTAREVEPAQRAEQEAGQLAQKQHEEAEALAAAAAAKKRQEEAAAKAQHEEEAHPTQRRSPKLTVLKAKVVGQKLVLSLRLSTAGVVTVAGHSLKKISKSFGPGVRRRTVAIVWSAHRHAARVTVSLRATSGTVSHRLTLSL